VTIGYSRSQVERLLALSRTTVSGLISAGFVTPGRGPRGELRFDFADLMLLRIASGLLQAKIPPRKILTALAKLRETLPNECPLTGLRITAAGSDVAVRERDVTWAPSSGQLLLDFEVVPAKGSVAILPRTKESPLSAEDWVAQGMTLEEGSPLEAEAAYLNAIDSDPTHEDAYLNLGVLLCEAGRCGDAVTIYERALAQGIRSPELFYNLALAQEDEGRFAEAIESYRRCVREEPSFQDAHFNLARLEEQAGDIKAALRHFNDYRRLSRVDT
jgi:tetratricopeptide (TPR) repeat protein